MSDEKPEALLRSALEKIVYFEARSSQLSNDAQHASAEVDRLKADLAGASQREIELRRVIAELEVRTTRAHAEREETARVADALRRERAELIGKMLEASRIHGGTQQGLDDFDLAQFIAQLRSEVLVQRDGAPVLVPRMSDVTAPKPSAPPLPPAPLPRGELEQQLIDDARARLVAVGQEDSLEEGTLRSARTAIDDARKATTGQGTAGELAALTGSVLYVAAELKAQGRIAVNAADLARLAGAQHFPGRSEETLFGFSVRELSALDVGARVRAAERLEALKHPAAAPALATALHAETEAPAQVALLSALASLAGAEAVPLVKPLLTSGAPDVRIAALKALLTLDAPAAGPHLAAAMKDPDKAVRRRASLLALGLKGDDALELGRKGIADADPDVRALAALVLGASNAEVARPALLEAMRDQDLRVRRAAGQSLSKLLGQDVTSLVTLDEATRRREVRRLASVPVRPVADLSRALEERKRQLALAKRDVVTTAAISTAAVAPQPNVSSAPVAPPPRPAARVASELRAAPARVAVLEVEVDTAAPAPVPAALTASVLRELRAAIRGKPLPELASGCGASPDDTMRACGALISQGQVVRRGHKYFVA